MLKVQKIAFVVVAIFICVSPSAKQWFGTKTRHLPNWAMFYNTGLGQYRVQYFHEDENGLIRIDRREVLGLTGARPNRLTIKDQKAILIEARRICRELRLKQLTAKIHHSTLRGWRAVNSEKNFCERHRRHTQ